MAGLIFYALQWSEFQTTLTQKSAKWLSEKLGSTVTVGNVRIHWLDEIYLEDVNIKDTKGRDMIYVREIYVNTKTNFKLSGKKVVSFDNNLDFVMLKEPDVRLIREKDGKLNIDGWITNLKNLLQQKDANPNKKIQAFTIDEAVIQDGTFELYDEYKERFPEELFDYTNFEIKGITGNLKDFLIHYDTVSFKAKGIKGIEKRSDLAIKKIDTDFLYTRNLIELKRLDGHINNSILKNYLALHYDKVSDLNSFNDKVRLRAILRGSEFDSQDLGRFATKMYEYDERYSITGELTGKVKDLYFNKTTLGFGNGSYINGKGNFKGLPDVKNTFYHLELGDSRFLAPDTRQYAGNENYKKYVEQFDQVDFKGIFKGTFTDFFTEAKIKSSALGELSGKMVFEIEDKTKLPSYNADLVSRNINLAKITGNKSLKTVSFKGKVKGDGNSLKNASFDMDGQIDKIWFDNYTYQNVHVDGVLRRSRFDGRVTVKDPNLAGFIDGAIDFNKEQTGYNIYGKVEKANLKPLGYSEEDVKLETDFDFGFEGNKLDNWVGQADFNNTYAYTSNRNLVIDEISLLSEKIANLRKIGIKSEFVDAEVSGNFQPTELISDLIQLKNEYGLFFSGTESDRKKYYSEKKSDSLSRNYSAKYTIDFKDTENILAFLEPDISISKDAKVNGNIRIQSTSQFTVYGTVDTLVYKGNKFYQNELDFYSSKGWLSPKVLTSLILNSESQELANKVETERIEIGAAWGDGGNIDFDGKIRQKNTRNRAQLFGKLAFQPNGFTINLNPRNSIVNLLDYQWSFDRQNEITVRGSEVQFEDFRISNKNQSLALSGFISPDSTKQIFASINNFDLRALEPLAALQIQGIADGDVSMSNYYGNPILLSNLIVRDFYYKKILIGNVNAVVDWDNYLSKAKIESSIDRLGLEIMKVVGTYDPSIKKGVNLTAKLDEANLEIFGTFVDNIFSDLKGFANGNLRITGNPRDLIARGEVKLSKGQLKINATGGYLYFNDSILFTEEGFVAKPGGFKVYDAPVNGNEAYLTGGIFNGGEGVFLMGLDGYIKDPDGFKLMNTALKDNESFYGTAYATGDIHLSGSFTNVLITANLESKRNTKVTIPLDGAETVNTNQEAIPFASKPEETPKENKEDAPVKKQKELSGVKMVFNLKITPDAECEIIIDRRNNDKLNAFGNGRLTIGYDTRSDNFTMSGPYVVTSGKYDFSFQNLASLRKFEIAENSRITWSGDPYRAVLDMKAGYTANVDMSAIWVSDTEETTDNNRYPVNVVVNMTGQLETPNISYDLSFDESRIPNRHHTDLYAFQQRLRDNEQLLSKNVSFVIALNSLYPETNSFQALDQEFLVENISSMLSNQIGNLANKLDPNLEVGVLLGDFRQNLLNNMQLNFSYSFLNNRAKLSGRSSYANGVNETFTTVNQGQLTVGGELEYLLSEDGMWRLQVHSRSVPSSNYSYSLSNVVGGNVMVSGANVLFSRNFNSLIGKKNKIPIGVGRKEEEAETPLNPEVSLLD